MQNLPIQYLSFGILIANIVIPIWLEELRERRSAKRDARIMSELRQIKHELQRIETTNQEVQQYGTSKAIERIYAH